MLLGAVIYLTILSCIAKILGKVCLGRLSSRAKFHKLLGGVIVFVIVTITCLVRVLVNNAVPLQRIIVAFCVYGRTLDLLRGTTMFIPVPRGLGSMLLRLESGRVSESSRNRWRHPLFTPIRRKEGV